MLSFLQPVSGLEVGYSSATTYIPQGENATIKIQVANMALGEGQDIGRDGYVIIGDPQIVTNTGEPTPEEWWEITVDPPLENFEVNWQQFEAHFFLPLTRWENELPSLEDLPENFYDYYDTYWEIMGGRYVPAKEVQVHIATSENVPLGEYKLDVTISLHPPPSYGGSGMGSVTSIGATPKINIVGPPPPTPPPPPLPVWATILLIGVLVCIAGGLVYAIKKGKIKI